MLHSGKSWMTLLTKTSAPLPRPYSIGCLIPCNSTERTCSMDRAAPIAISSGTRRARKAPAGSEKTVRGTLGWQLGAGPYHSNRRTDQPSSGPRVALIHDLTPFSRRSTPPSGCSRLPHAGSSRSPSSGLGRLVTRAAGGRYVVQSEDAIKPMVWGMDRAQLSRIAHRPDNRWARFFFEVRFG